MNAELIVRMLGEISDELVLDAAPGTLTNIGAKGRTHAGSSSAAGSRMRRRWVAVAACICVVVLGAFFIGKGIAGKQRTPGNIANTIDWNNIGPEKKYDDLPVIRLSYLSDGQGFGIGIYQKDDLPSSTMLKAEDIPQTLPVYKNTSYDPAGFPYGLDRKQMQTLLKNYADGLKIRNYTIEDVEDTDPNGEGSKLVGLEIKTEDLQISVWANGTSYISGSSQKLKTEDLNYILGFDTLVFGDKHNVGATIDGKIVFDFELVYGIVDASEPLRQAQVIELLYYNSNRLSISNSDLVSEYLGDYPVISLDKAMGMLDEGKFVVGSGVDAFPGRDSIVACDIHYEVGPTREMFVPYYHFWVRMPDEVAAEYGGEGLSAFGELYVPAIDEKYLDPATLTWN